MSVARIKLTPDQDFDLKKVPKTYFVNHPLSTRISERSSNFDGFGLTPKEFDDSFLYTDSYSSGLISKFNICMRSMKLVYQKTCVSDQQGYVTGLSPIPSSGSVLVTAVQNSPAKSIFQIYTLKKNMDGAFELTKSVEYFSNEVNNYFVGGRSSKAFFQNKDTT